MESLVEVLRFYKIIMWFLVGLFTAALVPDATSSSSRNFEPKTSNLEDPLSNHPLKPTHFIVTR
tara:strand:- start:90 stop:281 length:192 start_codon:yes stop_codon:yes gene_type:complete